MSIICCKPKINSYLFLLSYGLFLVTIFQSAIAVPAFPGAEGYGAAATGGRGGQIYIVTNLNDSGTGSLRAALNHNTPRTIVFQVSGTIHLYSNLDIKYPNVTIAGQTAPGDGICIANGSLYAGYDNVIIRYIRCRLGDRWPDGTDNSDTDATWARYGDTIILDHVTASWSIDEVLSYYANTNLTVQWCIISESLRYSHHEKGAHGYGGIWGSTNSSFHHNLLAHHSSRNPRVESNITNMDLRNNVIYNWGFNSCYGGEGSNVNIVNCYYKPGPATSSSADDRIVNPSLVKEDGEAVVPHTYGQWYVAGNYVYGNTATTADNSLGIDPEGGTSERSLCQSTTSLPVATTYPVTTQTAQDAFDSVLADAGCSLVRDSVDTRIIEEVRTGTATYGGQTGEGLGIIDSQETVGSWPTLNSLTAPTDTDSDGMPDAWETANGLTITDPEDRNDYDLDPDYTNLEVYINSLVAKDTTPPSAPTGLTANAYDSSIELVWNPNTDTDLAGYYLHRSTTSGSNHEIINSEIILDAYYTDNSAENGTTYYYAVTAIDSSSNESDYSSEVFATAVDMSFYHDSDQNGSIDIDDLTAFSSLWLQDDCPTTTGWDINNDCIINLDEFSLLSDSWLKSQTQPYPEYLYAADSCRTSLYSGTESEADINKSELNKLSVRSDNKAAKSWIKFDLSTVDVTVLTTAHIRVTLYEDKDSTCCLSAVNDDYIANIDWTKSDLTWNTAPGNITSTDGINPNDTSYTVNDLQDNLRSDATTLINTIDYSEGTGGSSGDQYLINVLEILQQDTDDIVQFILHGAGGSTNFTTNDSTLGAEYWPKLELSY